MSKSMIGLDPLAWLAPNSGSATTKKKKSKTKKKAAKKKAAAVSKVAKKKVAKKKVAQKKIAQKKIAQKKIAKKKTTKKKVVAKNKTNSKKSEIKKVEVIQEIVEPQVVEVIEPEVVEVVESNVSTEEMNVSNIESEESKVTNSTIKLAEVQDISLVEELHNRMADLINTTDIVFDGSDVERIDGASLQLIACAFKQAEKYGNKVSWNGSSDALKESARLLGVTNIIGL